MKRALLADKRTALPAALFCCLLWGSAFPTVKAGLDYMTPTFFAGARFTIAGIAVLALAARRGTGLLSVGYTCWRAVVLIGIFQTVIGYFLFFHGMSVSSAATGSIIVSSGPIMVAIMAYPLLGEGGWAPAQVSGIVFGFTGVALALLQPGWRPGFSLRGEGLVLLSTLSLSYSSILVKKIAGKVDPMIIAGGSMAFGGIVLLGFASFFEPPSRQVFTLGGHVLLLYAAFISAAAFSLWYALLRHHPVSTISTIKFSIPIIGSVLSALTLGEELTIHKLAGGILVGAGIYLIFRRKGEVTPAVTTGP